MNSRGGFVIVIYYYGLGNTQRLLKTAKQKATGIWLSSRFICKGNLKTQSSKLLHQMTQIVYRLLNSTDRERYRRVRLECLTNYPDYFGDSYEEEINADPSKFEKTFLLGSDHSFLYGAFSQGILIGISGFIHQKRIKTGHRGDLVQVYVDPSFSGQGIGSRLIELTIAKAFDNIFINQILLSVVRSNDRAIKLYKEFGFVKYGVVENYFKVANRSWAQVFMALTRQNYITNTIFKEWQRETG
jgi:ribosomal protein S18 acetylase RimI-like enzyme